LVAPPRLPFFFRLVDRAMRYSRRV
jgi:hypothetical protein